jgi:hypothetical protein
LKGRVAAAGKEEKSGRKGKKGREANTKGYTHENF